MKYVVLVLVLLWCTTASAVWLFDATDTVSVADADVLTMGSAGWTVAGWVKSSGASAASRAIFTWGDPATQHHAILSIQSSASGSSLYLDWRGSHNTLNLTMTGDTAIGASTEWHHVAIVRNADLIYMYVDGVEEEVSYYSVLYHWSCDATTPWVWGSTTFDSQLADWSKWSRTISVGESSELSALVAGGLPENASGGAPAWQLDMYDGVDCQSGDLALTNSGVTASTTGHPVSRAAPPSSVLILVW